MKPQDLPSAPLHTRLLALLYDTFILLALSMAYSAAATLLMAALLGVENTDDYRPMQSGSALELGFAGGWLATIAAFYWFFWYRAGQTVGMRAWRLKIVDACGNTPNHRQCWLRMLVSPVALGLAGLGYFWCLLSPQRAAWQDIASGTRVVLTPKPRKKA